MNGFEINEASTDSGVVYGEVVGETTKQTLILQQCNNGVFDQSVILTLSQAEQLRDQLISLFEVEK